MCYNINLGGITKEMTMPRLIEVFVLMTLLVGMGAYTVEWFANELTTAVVDLADVLTNQTVGK